MAELYSGRVIYMAFGGASAGDIRMLEALLDGIEGITGFAIDTEQSRVVVFADERSDTESDIARAMLASGMYPVVSGGAVGVDGQGRMAC